jgi:hypothetical protein
MFFADCLGTGCDIPKIVIDLDSASQDLYSEIKYIKIMQKQGYNFKI